MSTEPERAAEATVNIIYSHLDVLRTWCGAGVLTEDEAQYVQGHLYAAAVVVGKAAVRG